MACALFACIPPRDRRSKKRCARYAQEDRKMLVFQAGQHDRWTQLAHGRFWPVAHTAYRVKVPRSLRREHWRDDPRYYQPFVCPGCHAVSEPCAPWCPDDSIRRDREERAEREELFAQELDDALLGEDADG